MGTGQGNERYFSKYGLVKNLGFLPGAIPGPLMQSDHSSQEDLTAMKFNNG